MQGLNKIVKKTLSNGVKVYFYKDSSLKRIFMTYNVNYGSHGYFNNIKLNGKKVTLPFGMAHFLENTLIENSNRRLTYDMAIKIAEVFHLKPDDLFYEELLT